MPSQPQVNIQRLIEYGLASIWLSCLLFTVMEWLMPVEVVNRSLFVGAHWGVVLLFIYPVSRLIAGLWLTRKLIRWLAKSVAVGVVFTFFSFFIHPYLFFYILSLIVPVVHVGSYFFFGGNRWQTEYVHFRRGQEVMVSQTSRLGGILAGERTVRLTPVTPFLQWVRPVPFVMPGEVSGDYLYDRLSQAGPRTPGFVGWTRVGAAHQAGDHAQDSAHSQHFAAMLRTDKQLQERSEERRRVGIEDCNRRRRTKDSLALLGQLPTWQLPAITCHGANTFGCRLGDQLWRNHSLEYNDTAGCTYQPAWGHLDRAHALRVYARMRLASSNRYMELVIPEINGPGTYQLAPYSQYQPANGYWSFKEDSDIGSHIQYFSAGAQVRISKFDTVARIAAGTFQGHLYRHGAPDTLIPLRQGRFDVRF